MPNAECRMPNADRKIANRRSEIGGIQGDRILQGKHRLYRPTIRPAIALAAVLMVAWPVRPVAHDIPADVTIRVFAQPEGHRLRLLIRVPMSAMRDIDWPRRADGYLDLARLDPFLRDASTLWIGDDVDLFEGDVRLAYPQVRAVRLSLEEICGAVKDAIALPPGGV